MEIPRRGSINKLKMSDLEEDTTDSTPCDRVRYCLVYNDFISSRNLIGQQYKYYAKSSQNHSMDALNIITKNINNIDSQTNKLRQTQKTKTIHHIQKPLS